MKWRFQRKKQDGGWWKSRPVVVEATRWFDARAWARSYFNTDELFESETKQPPDVELKWEGDDFNHGGTPDGRRLFVRSRAGQWERAQL